ncbi:hypothetical protein Fmac_020378 [Flemingia macrophylla]|uniref:GH3 C-terminal domain-containing protein n=1 Tax=Flemingia macrophylla TaxID=520843 RepID=A0ABD1LTU7_9FABA
MTLSAIAAAMAQSLAEARGWMRCDDGFQLDDGRNIDTKGVGLTNGFRAIMDRMETMVEARLGDVLEVVGFHKGSLELNFVRRRKPILTANIDKNTEKDLQLVVESGSQILNKAKAELVDLTSFADGKVEDKVLRPCYIEMDKSFTNHGYVVSTKTNSIGPLELSMLDGGIFKKILNTFIANEVALSQFKTPKCTNNHVFLKILNNPTTRKSTTPLLTKSPKTTS